MSINVNKITSTLAKLGDPELQQYAQMHKNDPYIMALAMLESNRRKEVRAADQDEQEQPTVVDQMVAEMAPQQMPEDQGIGQLPAGDMNFAGGGIVAFADGGGVERYGDLGFTGFSYGDWAEANARRRREKLEAERAKNMAAVSSGQVYAPVGEPAPLFTDPRLLGATPAAETVGYATPKAANAALVANTGKAKDSAPAANLNPAAPGTKPAAPGGKPPAQAGIDALNPNKLYETALKEANKTVNPEKGMLEELATERKTAAEEELTGIKALNEKFADAFKGRRERLDAREGAIGKMKDQNFGLALLQAGAAMMSTPGNIGTALGKGVQVGSQQYVAGIDKINSVKDKLADARDRLDDLQLNRDEMSAREILKAESKIRDTALASQETMIKYVMDRDKVDRETAMKIVDNQIKVGLSVYEQQQANAREQIRASAPGQTERLVDRMARDPKFAESYKNYSSIGPEAKGIEAELQAYLKNPMLLKATNAPLAAQFDAIIQQRMGSLVKPQAGAGSRD